MKKLLVALFAVGLASFAQASYLYWQVNSDAATAYGANGVRVLYGETFEAATSNPVNIYATDGSLVGNVVDPGTAANPGYLVDLKDVAAGTAFYIELVKYNTTNSSWDSVGFSGELAYADIGKYTVDLNAVAPTLPAAWTGGSYAAPEPTSGLLMLLGVAALGLKRRKA